MQQAGELHESGYSRKTHRIAIGLNCRAGLINANPVNGADPQYKYIYQSNRGILPSNTITCTAREVRESASDLAKCTNAPATI